MTTAIAYILVVPLVQFCLTAGVSLVGFPIALLLAWTSISLRTKICGFVGGVAGIALAVSFGYGVFRLLVGPDSYTLGVFVASIVPLLVPIRNDCVQSQRVKAARQQLLDTIRESRGEDVARALAGETETSHGSAVVGEIAGLVLAIAWFFGR
jgi:hypothetical protein